MAAMVVASVAGWAFISRQSEDLSGRQFDSIAVLPFRNLTGDAAFGYFADGIADELIAILSRLPEVHVPAQSSSFHFRGADRDVRAIADSLGVEVVVEGSVRREQDRIRVNVELIDARDGYHIWTDTFDRSFQSWLETQAEIARLTIRSLGLELPPGWTPPSITTDLNAWQEYEKAIHWWLKRTRAGSDTAIVYFRRAIEHDSTYARAWAGLANAHLTGMFWGFVPVADSIRESTREAAERSVELDSMLVEGITALAAIHHEDGELETAERMYLRAIELNPNYSTARLWYVELLLDTGRPEQALDEARKAYSLDPMSPISAKVLGDVLRRNLLLEEALDYWQYAIDMEPGHWSGHANLSRALICLGRFDEGARATAALIRVDGDSDFTARNHYLARDYGRALEIVSRLRETSPYASAELASRVHAELGNWDRAIQEYRTTADENPGDAYTALLLAYIYARSGKASRARAIVDAPGRVADQPSVDWNAAAVHAALGDNDRAFELLERAHRGRKSSVMTLAVNPRYDALRQDPRYSEFLVRVGLPNVGLRLDED